MLFFHVIVAHFFVFDGFFICVLKKRLASLNVPTLVLFYVKPLNVTPFLEYQDIFIICIFLLCDANPKDGQRQPNGKTKLSRKL